MRITFLGTGTSHGVPTIDCMLDDHARCPHGVCRKAEHERRYRRLRASLLVEVASQSLLLDTSQDFRQQMLENQVRRLDAVLVTHGHADHIYGLPDIRSYCRAQGAPIDVYGAAETLDVLRGAFSYAFVLPPAVGGGIPSLCMHLLDTPADVHGVRVTPIPVVHGALQGCQGYRIGDMAYIPDVKTIPPSSLELLSGLDLLILNCLRITPHSTHLSLAESLAYAAALKPCHCLLTHLTHDIDYQLEEPNLPAWVRFAYDGLQVDA
jgi:phosphoribosyl 1,2-cyclic phosphate phosphodiesterase